MKYILSTTILLLLTNLLYSQITSFDTTFIINHQKIHITAKNLNSNYTVLNSTYASHKALNDTIKNGGLIFIDLPDFNHDGYVDILVNYSGNNPTYYLYLFDHVSKKFKNIKNYMSFPDAIQLKSNPKYYYSYYHNGCADMNWVSDLFKIVDYKIIQVGHIRGQGCDFEVIKNPQVIKIYKVINNNEEKGKLISELPYLKYIVHFEDKWDFIKRYWNKNYQKFD